MPITILLQNNNRPPAVCNKIIIKTLNYYKLFGLKMLKSEQGNRIIVSLEEPLALPM